MSRDFFPAICAFTRIMSITGMPSVMQMTSSTPASTASRIESAAPGAGTKITDDVAAGFLARFPNGVENRNFAVKRLSAFSGRHAGHDLRPVLHALPRMKTAGAAGDSLDAETGSFVDEDGHR